MGSICSAAVKHRSVNKVSTAPESSQIAEPNETFLLPALAVFPVAAWTKLPTRSMNRGIVFSSEGGGRSE